MKKTKQGVRDLNVGPRRHTHRFLPVTHVSRSGQQVTNMKCWCGEQLMETEKRDDSSAFGYE